MGGDDPRSLVDPVVQIREGNMISDETEIHDVDYVEGPHSTLEEELDGVLHMEESWEDGIGMVSSDSSLCQQLDNTSSTLDASDSSGVQLAREVEAGADFNFRGARIPIPTHWNTELLEQLLQGYDDCEVAQFIKFGWPIDRDASVPLTVTTDINNSS